MKVLAWYSGGRTYRVTTPKGWERLPGTGALWFVRFDAGGRQRVNGADWIWLEGEVIRSIPSGPWGTWRDPPEVAAELLKRGDRVTDAEFAAVEAEALGATWR